MNAELDSSVIALLYISEVHQFLLLLTSAMLSVRRVSMQKDTWMTALRFNAVSTKSHVLHASSATPPDSSAISSGMKLLNT